MSEVPLIGGLFNDGTTVTIRKPTAENGAANWLGVSDSQINSTRSAFRSAAAAGRTDRRSSVYHEMHIRMTAFTTRSRPEVLRTTHRITRNNLERVAVGLPIDHDNDPSTRDSRPGHPSNLTENTLRDEMKLPLRRVLVFERIRINRTSF